MLLQFYRVDAIPDPPSKGVCYVTRDGESDTAVMHFVSKDGTFMHSIGHDAGDTLTSNSIHSVDNITERDASVLTSDSIVMVLDASDDPYVISGPAMYYYVESTNTYILTSNGGTGHIHTASLLDIDKAAILAANNQSPMGSNPSW